MIKRLQAQSIGVRLCFAFAYNLGMYMLFFLITPLHDVLAIVFVLLIPVFYGSAVPIVMDPYNQKLFSHVWWLGMIPICILCLILLVINVETMVCVIIILPVMALGMMIGQAIMRALLRRSMVEVSSDRVNISLLMLPVLLVPVFGQINFPYMERSVITQMRIAASPEVIWDNTLEIDAIQDDERLWTLSHNILQTPLPIDASVDGIIRKLRWSGGVRFEEHLTKVIENRLMVWDFVFNEPETLIAFDSHIAPQGGIVYMQTGSYELAPLADGDTLLTLKTNYSIRSPINSYLALWGELFLQEFHHAVLSVIKARSEKVQQI